MADKTKDTAKPEDAPEPEDASKTEDSVESENEVDAGDAKTKTEDKSRRGVGPWEGPWPEGDHWDEELLRDGDYRNVEDQYRYWTREAIAEEIASHSHLYEVAIENLGHDFNIGSIVRTANAMGVRKVHIVGRRRWNRRGAMVTDRYLEVIHHPDVESFTADVLPRGYSISGIDNLPHSVPLEKNRLPEKTVLVFGEEGPGLSEEMAEACENIYHITQYGSTRSVNVGHAAAIAMWSWVTTWV